MIGNWSPPCAISVAEIAHGSGVYRKGGFHQRYVFPRGRLSLSGRLEYWIPNDKRYDFKRDTMTILNSSQQMTTTYGQQGSKRPSHTPVVGALKRQKVYDFETDETADPRILIPTASDKLDITDITLTPIMGAKRKQDMKTQRPTDDSIAAPGPKKDLTPTTLPTQAIYGVLVGPNTVALIPESGHLGTDPTHSHIQKRQQKSNRHKNRRHSGRYQGRRMDMWPMPPGDKLRSIPKHTIQDKYITEIAIPLRNYASSLR